MMNSCMKLSLCINDYEQTDLYIELFGPVLPLVVLPSFQYPEIPPTDNIHLMDFWTANGLHKDNLMQLIEFIRAINIEFNYMQFAKWLSDYFIALSTDYPCAKTLTYRIARTDLDLFYCDLSKSNVVGF